MDAMAMKAMKAKKAKLRDERHEGDARDERHEGNEGNERDERHEGNERDERHEADEGDSFDDGSWHSEDSFGECIECNFWGSTFECHPCECHDCVFCEVDHACNRKCHK